MMNCGYDSDSSGRYDTPPIAPQMWHAYHISGEMSVIALLGALAHRLRTGEGQQLSLSIHEAVSMNTESDLPNWIFLRQRHFRQTCRHSMASTSLPALAQTRDGRYLLPYRTYLRATATYSSDALRGTISVLAKHGMDEGLGKAGQLDAEAEAKVGKLVDRLAASLDFDADLWRDGQDNGLPWAPVRRPEENARDPHYIQRGIFASVPHPESGASYTYVAARWYSSDAPWTVSAQRPARLGEHTRSVVNEWAAPRRVPSLSPDCGLARGSTKAGPTGKPFALSGVRVVDLGWMLASAGAGRYLAALGAEVIKVEHELRADGMRFGASRLSARRTRRTAGGHGHDPDASAGRAQSQRLLHGDQRWQARDIARPEEARGQADPGGSHPQRRRGARGLFAGNDGPDGTGLRSAARAESRHHLSPAVGVRPARRLWPGACLRPDRASVQRHQRHVRLARASSARRHRLLVSRLVRRLQHGDRGARRALSGGPRRAAAVTSTRRRRRSASS